MNASVQRDIGPAELALLLALVRGGSLAAAAQLAGVDTSTVFRTVQRAEKSLGPAPVRALAPGLPRHRARPAPGRACRAHRGRARRRALGRAGARGRGQRPGAHQHHRHLLNGLLLPSLRALCSRAPATAAGDQRTQRAGQPDAARGRRGAARHRAAARARGGAPPRADPLGGVRRRAPPRRAGRARSTCRRRHGLRWTMHCPSIRPCAGAASTCRASNRRCG